MDSVKPRELLTAARIADALVYATGVAGVVAGGLLLRNEDYGFAVVAWALTFVAGAALRLAAWAARALAELLTRTSRIQDDLARIAAAQQRHPELGPQEPGDVPDPYRRWGGWH